MPYIPCITISTPNARDRNSMGYRGFVQRWCPDGHYWTTPDRLSCASRNERDESLKQDTVCPSCKKQHAAYNEVDDTNCDAIGFLAITDRLPTLKEMGTFGRFWHQEMKDDPFWIEGISSWEPKDQRAGWRWLETGL